MRYLQRKQNRGTGLADNDPMNSVANLFDLGLVFIVGLLLALFGTYHLQELLQHDSRVTITKESADGAMQIIIKDGRKIEAVKVGKQQTEGKGRRLGTAYRLENGTMVYVPEENQ